MSLELTMADSSSSCQKSTLESNGNPKNVENAYSDIDLLFHKNFLEEGNNFFQGEHICFTDTEEMSSSNENFDSYNLMRDNYEFGLPISNILFENIKPQIPKRKKFEVIYPIKVSLFTETENTLNNKFILKKRKGKINKRMDNQDNIRRKIKRGFFSSVTDNLNKVLNTIGSKFYFMKFSRTFSSDVVRKNNKDLLYMTLENIFEKKELFKENELDNYYHNLKVVKSEEIQGNEDLKKIMGKTYFELFNEYINSKEFKIDEIRRLRENNMEESYIQKYIFLAQHLLEFFQNL